MQLPKPRCGKDKAPKPVTEVVIGPQTLAEVKATVQGKWKLHYSIGGYTGKIRVDFLNTILQFTSTDSMYRWDQNVLRIQSKVTFQYERLYAFNQYYTYMIVIENPANMMDNWLTVYAKKGDTLVIAETQHTNPEKYYLTKQ